VDPVGSMAQWVSSKRPSEAQSIFWVRYQLYGVKLLLF
jgi:hypothetical protein